jgi:hypothetical protein
LVVQSEKSGSESPLGNGIVNPTTLCGDPVPSIAWHVAQLFFQMYSPSAPGGSAFSSEVGGVTASCAACSETAPVALT